MSSAFSRRSSSVASGVVSSGADMLVRPLNKVIEVEIVLTHSLKLLEQMIKPPGEELFCPLIALRQWRRFYVV